MKLNSVYLKSKYIIYLYIWKCMPISVKILIFILSTKICQQFIWGNDSKLIILLITITTVYVMFKFLKFVFITVINK